MIMAYVFLFVAVALLVVGISFALSPGKSPGPMIDAFFVLVSFFFLLMGLRYVFGGVGNDNPLAGAFIASLALTFFWFKRRRQS
jgi:hypothetical protein